MELEKRYISSKQLHKYVWMLVGVFALMAMTFPTAMMRVSQKEKFHGYHVKSLPIDGKFAVSEK
ncbi:hypothetical protein [Nostoc sp. TCL26-01]|uniref:hypothetical protein n=1 Tax=Nostoc sp. TCL26-01 TaxID=2576904 RepID=UPI0015C0CE77|nr:hypothetical protein [Nostoc sp. TCL26-01]QLE55068.1 hypothetical protein FD725_05810 [Nostoc sp. TCL26-01]